jgi:hypothetical protein
MDRGRAGDLGFAMAGLVAVLLVIALVQTGTTDPAFTAGRDRLFAQ